METILGNGMDKEENYHMLKYLHLLHMKHQYKCDIHFEAAITLTPTSQNNYFSR